MEARDNRRGFTPLHKAVAFNEDAAKVSALLDAGANPNARNKYGDTPLHLAAVLNKHPSVVTALLDAGANLEARDNRHGFTPLHRAKNSDVVTAFIEAGANLEAKDEYGATPLHLSLIHI